MNVAVYTTFGFPHGGAPENFVRQLCLGLKENGAHVQVTRLKGSNFSVPESYEIDSSDLLYRNRPRNGLVLLLFIFCSFLLLPLLVWRDKWRHNTNAILIFGADYPHFCVPLLIACKLLNIKIFRIATDHFDDHLIATSWWKKIKIPLMNFQFRVVDRYFDGIIVVTDYLKNMAMKNGVSGSRVLQVPHFIDPRPFFRPEIQQLRSKENVTFGFCGDTNVRNGLIDLLIAFEKTELSYKNIRLIIIGSRFQELEQHLSGITNLELKAKIEITGFVSATVVQEKLNLCDILINPRRNGRFAEAGFPTKLGEYFSTRLPVISTVTGDIRKYFTHEKEMILTQPENPVELANAMMRLIINESERKAIGERGYKWACEHLEYKANALIVKQFIEKM